MGTRAWVASFAILIIATAAWLSPLTMASPLAIRPISVAVLASGNSVAQTRFPLTDALGTTNGVADENGLVVERDYFDAWGLRSAADGTPLPNLTLFQSLSSGGYTNQEHDDELALINMQGRLYDPALGRFLSPDPLVGSPAFTESWNSYSYVTNNPLNFTDPSGFDPCPPGFYCTTAAGNEITNTIQWQFGNETFDDGASAAAIGTTPGGNVGAVVMGAFAFLQDQKRLAQQHALEVKAGHFLSDGTRIRSADGTPLLPRRLDIKRGNALVDNWGTVIRGGVLGPIPSGAGSAPRPTPKPSWIEKKTSGFAVRLACGRQCASANAPTTAREKRTNQLSNVQTALNDKTRALAMLSVLRFIGKVGVVIDEGIDGIIDRLMPEPLDIGGDDEGRNSQRQIQIVVAGLAWHTALARYMRANQRFDAAIVGVAEATHPGDLRPDESHIAELARGVYEDAEVEYWAASDELTAAGQAELAAQSAYAELLGRPLSREDYPDWYRR